MSCRNYLGKEEEEPQPSPRQQDDKWGGESILGRLKVRDVRGTFRLARLCKCILTIMTKLVVLVWTVSN